MQGDHESLSEAARELGRKKGTAEEQARQVRAEAQQARNATRYACGHVLACRSQIKQSQIHLYSSLLMCALSKPSCIHIVLKTGLQQKAKQGLPILSLCLSKMCNVMAWSGMLLEICRRAHMLFGNAKACMAMIKVWHEAFIVLFSPDHACAGTLCKMRSVLDSQLQNQCGVPMCLRECLVMMVSMT